MAFDQDEQDDPSGGSASVFSRRSFLKTVGGTSFAAGVLSPTLGEAQTGPVAVGPGDVPIELNINGTVRRLTVEPRVTLLDAMRNRLDITGVKRVCDRGTCGACTVLADGRPIYACSHLAIEMQGRAIRTVESFTEGTCCIRCSRPSAGADGLMCGFCTRALSSRPSRCSRRTPSRRPSRRRQVSRATSAGAAPTPASSKRS